MGVDYAQEIPAAARRVPFQTEHMYSYLLTYSRYCSTFDGKCVTLLFTLLVEALNLRGTRFRCSSEALP